MTTYHRSHESIAHHDGVREDMRRASCDGCPGFPHACAGCMMTVLLGAPGAPTASVAGRPTPVALRDPGRGTGEVVAPTELPLDLAEQRAVDLFVAAGLIDQAQATGLFATVEPLTDQVPGRRERRGVGVA